jgi:glutamate racemase
MIKWEIEKIDLPLIIDWKISRSSTNKKQNFIVKISEGEHQGLGEVAFNVRYGESLEKIKSDFELFLQNVPNDLHGLEQLENLIWELDLAQSLRAGIQMAFINYLSVLSNKPVHELVGVRSISTVKSSFSLPIIEIDTVETMLNKLSLHRFSNLKIKIGEQNPLGLVHEVAKHFKGTLRLDANEAFKSSYDVLKFMEKLPLERIEFMEQPMPSSMHEEYLILKKSSPLAIFADESITSEDVTEYYAERFHGVNVKLMKSGGYYKALKQLRDAKLLKMKTMVGCMIETTLGISAAMHLTSFADYCDLDGFLFLENDPFKLVFEEKGKIHLANLH